MSLEDITGGLRGSDKLQSSEKVFDGVISKVLACINYQVLDKCISHVLLHLFLILMRWVGQSLSLAFSIWKLKFS